MLAHAEPYRDEVFAAHQNLVSDVQEATVKMVRVVCCG